MNHSCVLLLIVCITLMAKCQGPVALHTIKYINYLFKSLTDAAAVSPCSHEFGSITMNSLLSICKWNNQGARRMKSEWKELGLSRDLIGISD